MRTTFPVAAPDEAWAALSDPSALAAALPGCRSVTRDVDGDGTLHVVTEVAVASVRGVWVGTVVPVDADAVRVSGAGEPGNVDLVVRADPARAALTVEGTVDGPLGTVGSAVLAAAVRRTAEAVLAAAAAAARPSRVPVTESVDFQRIASPEPSTRPGRRRAVAAAGVGAAFVLGLRWRRARPRGAP
ncbi:MAG TPA: SRPBCC domain-containing protein [Acidimicrobiales bacterium]|nr:SRPBCC domain-containing protein [Acidimicrobiales bacterium]